MIGTMPRPAAGARIVVRAQGARGRVSRGFAAVDGARGAGQDHGAPVQPSGRDGVRANGFYRRLGWEVVAQLEEGDVRYEKVRQAPA